PMDYLCSVFRCDDSVARDTLHLFEQQGRITVDELGVIRITNWDKYQSEYQQKRQRTRYGKSAQTPKNVRHESAQEVEGDKKESRGEAEKKGSAPDGASAYRGERLVVASKQDVALGEAFPWVDRPS